MVPPTRQRMMVKALTKFTIVALSFSSPACVIHVASDGPQDLARNAMFSFISELPLGGLGLDLDAAVADRLLERLPVSLVLVGVGDREVGQGFVEGLRFPQIASNQGGGARSGMSLGQRPSAELRVVAHGGRREELGERLDLHVPELAHVEMMAEHPHRPAQEEVTACLHDA